MLEGREKWQAGNQLISSIMTQKEKDERARKRRED
jgi:hypothetical protein